MPERGGDTLKMSKVFIKRIVSKDGSVELNDGVCRIPAAWGDVICDVLYGGERDGGLVLGTEAGELALVRKNGELSAVSGADGRALPEIGTENAGETLFGVKKDVFRRGAEGLCEERQRLCSLADAGARECARLEAAMMQSRNSARRSALSEMHGVKEKRTAAEKHHAAAAERLENARSAVRESFFGEADPELVRFEADADVQKSLALKKIAERRLSKLPQMLMLIAGLALALLTAWVLPTELWPWCFAAAGVLCLTSVLLFLRTGRLRMDAGEAMADRNAVLEKYGARSEEDIRALRDHFMLLCEELSAARTDERRAAQELSFARLHLKEQSADAVTKLDFTSGSSEAVLLARQLSDARALCEDAEQRLKRLDEYPLLVSSLPEDAPGRQIILLT